MKDVLRTTSPIGLLALGLLVVGGFIFAKAFSTNILAVFDLWYWVDGYIFHVLFGRLTTWLGLFLLVVGIVILYKRKEILTSRKAVINTGILIFTVGAAMTIMFELIFTGFLGYGIGLYFAFLIDKLLGTFGIGYHVAIIIFVLGFFYLYRQTSSSKNREIETSMNENIQQQEVTQAMQQQQKQLSVLQWLGTLILIGIPLVNLILLLVWGFGADNPRKKFSLGVLLYSLIVAVLSLTIVLLTVLAGI